MARHKKRPVGVVDARWKAIGYIDFNSAVSKLFSGKAVAIYPPKDQFVKGPPDEYGFQEVLPWPTLVRYVNYHHVEPDKLSPVDDALASRMAILNRDEWTCQYCGDGASTIDHIYPQWKGGENTWYNLVAACHECNGKKAGYTLEEINSWSDDELLERGFDGPMKLFREPFVPSPDKYASLQKKIDKLLLSGKIGNIEEY